MSKTAELLQSWFRTATPSAEDALAQVDDARARGCITGDEYLALLDAWPEGSALDRAPNS